jgi:uncharacterized protein
MTFGLKQENIEAINAVFAQYPAIEKVLIYGSRAKGDYRNGSDIDLVIVESGLSFSEQMEIETRIDDLLLPYKIDLVRQRQVSNPDLLEHISRVGKTFYQKDH